MDSEDEDDYLDPGEAIDASAGGVEGSSSSSYKADPIDADLLDFSTVNTNVSATPDGRPSTTLSSTSASWVEEMNAELAEVCMLRMPSSPARNMIL